jgi:multisubunit Na+/H+ antiporter MnhE subunit
VTRYKAATMVLTLVSALALASFHPGVLAVGAGLSAALLFTSRRSSSAATVRPRSRPRTHLARAGVAFVPFAVVVFREILVGNSEVTLVTLRLRPLVRPGIVAVPVGESDADGGGGLGGGHGAPRGSFFVDVDRE